MAKKKKKKGLQDMPTMSPERYLRERVRQLPIGRCFWLSRLEDGGTAFVVVTRCHPQGNLTIGTYVVDTYCRGVVSATYYFNKKKSKLDDILNQINDFGEPKEVKYEEVHNMIYGAIAFAEEVEIHPCIGFNLTQNILEEDTEDIPLIEYEYGRNGRYFLRAFSNEEAALYLPKLRKHLGDDFDYEIQKDEDDDNLDDESEPSLFDHNQWMEGEYAYQHKEYKQTEDLHHPWLQTLLTDLDKEYLGREDLDKILALPHDELRHDLKQLALAEMGRNTHDEYNDPYNPLIMHVFILLGEVGDNDSLELLLEMLRLDRVFYEYHICDGSSEIVKPALYKLAKDKMHRLVDFLKEPGLYCFARVSVLEVVLENLVCLEPQRKDEVINYAREIIEFLLSHADDPKYMDGGLAGFVCSGIMDLGAEELIPQIEELYETGNVDESICGTIQNVKRKFNNCERIDGNLILDIHDLYDYMKRVYKKY